MFWGAGRVAFSSEWHQEKPPVPLAQSLGMLCPARTTEPLMEAPELKPCSFSWLELCLPAKTWFLQGIITKSHGKRGGGCTAQSNAMELGELWAFSGSLEQGKMNTVVL